MEKQRGKRKESLMIIGILGLIAISPFIVQEVRKTKEAKRSCESAVQHHPSRGEDAFGGASGEYYSYPVRILGGGSIPKRFETREEAMKFCILYKK